MQKRFWNYRADDRTADLNYFLLGERPPGTYYGFDFTYKPANPLTLFLGPGATAFNGLDELNEPWVVSIAVSKQGVKVVEDAEIELVIEGTGAEPRVDAVILEHIYTFDDGGEDATYSVIKGAAGVLTPPAIPAGAIRIGDLYLPASCSALNASGVVWDKALKPNFAGKQMFNISSPNDTVEVIQNAFTEKTVINAKTRLAISDANLMLKTGHYLRPDTYGTNYPNAQASVIEVRQFNNYIQQICLVGDENKFQTFKRLTLDNGATWTPWVNVAPVSKNGTLKTELLPFTDPSFPGGINVERTTKYLGDFQQSTPNSAATIYSWLKRAAPIPDGENPFAKILPDGDFVLYVGTGLGNNRTRLLLQVSNHFTDTGVYSTVRVVWKGLSDLFQIEYKADTAEVGATVVSHTLISDRFSIGLEAANGAFYLGSDFNGTLTRVGAFIQMKGVFYLPAAFDLNNHFARLAFGSSPFIKPELDEYRDCIFTDGTTGQRRPGFLKITKPSDFYHFHFVPSVAFTVAGNSYISLAGNTLLHVE